MAVKLNEKHGGKVLEVHVRRKLTHDDYQHFTPVFEQMIKQHGKISILFEMADFRGWDARALWDDLMLDRKHFADIKRLAMVGDKKWEKAMSVVCRPFTKAKIRYFDRANAEAANAWLEGG